MAAKVAHTFDQEAALEPWTAERLPFGQAHWWLRAGSDFVKLPRKVRGDEAFRETVFLEPGTYTLGVGPPRGGVRIDIVVKAPAEAARPPRPTAAPRAPGLDVAGATIVLTGDLDAMGRDQAKTFFEGLGAKVASSVSKKTTLLVAGREPGPKKLEQASALGIRVIHEPELAELFDLEAPAALATGSTTGGSTKELVAGFLAKVDAGGLDLKRVEKLVGPSHFRDLGLHEHELWGISIGPRGGEYYVHIDLRDQPKFGMRCNCSSKKPCTHSYALLLTADRHFVPPAAAPDGHKDRSRYVSFME
jgi:BRCA1 C Terminus (BRCT) domain